MKIQHFALTVSLLAVVACGSVHEGYQSGGQGGTNSPVSDPNRPTREQEILAQEKISFADVQEVALGAKCTGCHSAGGRRADLGSLAAMLADPALLTPGDPQASEIFTRVQSGDMPFRAPPLNKDAVAVLERWILEGAGE